MRCVAPALPSCSGQLVVSGNVYVTLTEAVEKNIAGGSGGGSIDCTGTTQTVEVLVTADSGRAFRKGSAIADGTINVCTVDFSFCANQQVKPTIKIHA